MNGVVRAASLLVSACLLAVVPLSSRPPGVSHQPAAAYAMAGERLLDSAVRSVAAAPAMDTSANFDAVADTYVRSGAPNTNEGGSTFMRLQASGDNRGLVRFDQAAIDSFIGSGTVVSAKLRLTITDVNNNWGPSGRPVDVHRLTASWTEGNGFNIGGSPSTNGTGSGATWNCAIDTNISNQQKDCSGTTEWEMGMPNNPSVHPWVQTATDSETIVNGQSGVVEWTVTTDVAAFHADSATNFGWIVKKRDEGQAGQVEFAARQHANSSARPVLVITVAEAATNTPTPTPTPTNTPTNTPTATPTNTPTPSPAPVANDDSRTATGNIRIVTSGLGHSGFSVLANDTGPGLTVLTADTTSARGGEVAVAPDGTFSYNPPAGYEGSDTFNYTVSNVTGSDVGTVTITVSGMLWFIKNDATACTTVSAASGCGRLTNPLTSLAAFEAANGGTTMNGTDVSDPEAGDHIFIHAGTGSYTAPLTLENDQRVIGQGATGTVETLAGITFATDSDPAPTTGGTKPSLVSGGSGVNLATNNRLHGLAFDDTAGTAIASTNSISVGTLILGDIVVNNDGSAGAGIVLDDNGTSVTTTGTNTITTTAGTALNVTNTTIGAAGLTFQSISANGAANGIVLANTGTAGGLTVTGDGGGSNNGSGGTIQNTTGAGIDLNSVKNVSLGYLNITNPGADGIRIQTIDGFTLNRSNISDASGAPTDKGIDIGDFSTSTAVNGTINITNSMIGPATGSSPHDSLAAGVSSGTSVWNVTGSTFRNAGNSGINLEVRGSAVITGFNVSGSTFAGASPTTTTRGIFANTLEDAVLTTTIQTSTFTNNNIHIDLNQQNDTDPVGSHTFSILNNTTMTGANSHAINVFAPAGSFGGTFTGTIQGNVIGNAGVAGSGSAIGNGIRVNINGGSDATMLLDGNTVRQTPNGRGIEVIARNGTGGLDATVTNNDVDTQATAGTSLAAILLQSNAVSVANTLRSDVWGNTVPAASDAADLLPTYIALVESSTSTLELVDTAPPSANCTAQVTSANTGSASANAGCALIAGPISTP